MKQTHIYSRRYSDKQHGIVLVFCLILLLVTTLLGITAMSTTSLEESMTRNERDRHTAFQAAEAALREGERYVKSQATTPKIFADSPSFVDDCTNGLCTRREKNSGFDATISPCDIGGFSERWDMWSCNKSHLGNLAVWDNGKYRSHGNTSLINSKGISKAPKYIIEFLDYQSDGVCGTGGNPPCPELYRVTAFATGRTDDAKVMLQSLYQVSF